MLTNYCVNVREQFVNLLRNQEFVTDKTGVKCIEIVGANFIANEDHLFGAVNHDYVARELAWYKSQSLNVNDIPGEVPAIWKAVATPSGEINSNYGWAIWSPENGNQFWNALSELKRNPYSRRATMIYNRPSMWSEYNREGMSDFMCTFATQHFVRSNKLITNVLMRSNDAWAGYRNDFHWQKYVHKLLSTELQVEEGDIIWSAGSLHVYEKQFYLVDHYSKTGQTHISKEEYRKQYPNSIYI